MRHLWKYKSIILFALFNITQINAQNYTNGLTQKYENLDIDIIDSDSLDIEDAVITALNNNLEIREAFLDVKAIEKLIHQQGLYPNPQLALEAENIFGSKSFNGFNGSELTTTLSQDILLAGKLSKLKNIAELETNLAFFDYEIKRIEILTEVRKAFNNVIKIQTLLEKQIELLNNANSFIQNVKKRNEEGAVSSIEVLRANLAGNKLEIELKSTEQQLKSMKKNLAFLMGINEISASTFISDKKVIKVLPTLKKLKEFKKLNPEISKNKIIEQKDKAKIEYEKSLAVPDLTIAAGFRRMNEVNANTFLVGVSMPIPIFNHNQGNIASNEILLDRNRIRSEVISKNLESKITEIYNNAVSYQYSINAYKETLLPKAKEALEAIKNGYNQGRYKILDVIDSQNTLISIEMKFIESQNAFLNTICDIEKIIATSIENVK